MYKLLIFILCWFWISGCKNDNPLFKEVDSKNSHLIFNNEIIEDDILNPMNYEYIYNGGGVGIGDFNNDSLMDVYFTGSVTANKLFLNEGNLPTGQAGLKFKDVTVIAKVEGMGKWCKGVTVVDINNDGWKDIYVSCGVYPSLEARKNLLYINKGLTNGIPIFEEEAEAYGLADTSSTHMATFFDYDNDGDLDVYLLENDLTGQYANEFREIKKDGSFKTTDKLFENTFDSIFHHPVYKDVSKKAGITIEGYGLGVNICDINNDGWKDIYVSNDYISNNLLYVNQKNGTFKEECAQYFKHTSKNAMGNDIADINNDGLPDVFELDMAPADNYRSKMMMNDASYQYQQNCARFGYMHQYVRNTLQLNQGIVKTDSMQKNLFSEIAQLSGVSQTDWSWAPLLIDMDNDGWRDIMISNGLPKDISDMDFMAYRNNAVNTAAAAEVLKQVPTLKISNYIFKNNGDLTFTNKTNDWGWSTPTYSAGMAYADFDNDGDMDVVCNNTNMNASLLENKTVSNGENNYINISLKGIDANKDAIGSIIHLYYDNQHQMYDYTPYRGYMSSVQNIAHFGLGKTKLIDSIVVEWDATQKTILKQIKVNKNLVINAITSVLENKDVHTFTGSQTFIEITKMLGLEYRSIEADFIDFNIQKLLPHKLTQFGPSLSVGDINGDSLDDVIVGGGSPFFAKAFLQNSNGTFTKKNAVDSVGIKYQDDAGLCLFDADSDGDLDLFVASGGAENEPYSPSYNDNFYANDGKGKFTLKPDALPRNMFPKSAVKAADYDKDGDLDLFIGGRVLPGSYPKPVNSFIYKNESKNGLIKFTNVTAQVAPTLNNIGLVTDALWTDVDNDNFIDLIVIGEYMPVTIFKNANAVFKIQKTNIENEKGWMNSINGADLDNDGDIDYLIGNYGLNNFIKPETNLPLQCIANDFDKNGSYDAILFHSFPAEINGKPNIFPVFGRDDFLKELTTRREQFPNYTSYAKATQAQILTVEEIKTAYNATANNFTNAWIENKGDFNFEWHTLPIMAQISPIFGTILQDVNNDNNIDIIITGNDFTMHPFLGRQDASNGLVLINDGNKNFKVEQPQFSGFYVGGNTKSLSTIIVKNEIVNIATQNNGAIKAFKLNTSNNFKLLNNNDVFAMIEFANGKKQKQEFYFGNSFQSQSSRYLKLYDNVKKIEITTTKGEVKNLN
jgi:enediyne biosynthesis protein E4